MMLWALCGIAAGAVNGLVTGRATVRAARISERARMAAWLAGIFYRLLFLLAACWIFYRRGVSGGNLIAFCVPLVLVQTALSAKFSK